MGKAVLGVILVVVGILMTIAGALTAATFGPSGTLQTASTPLSTTREGYALVADVVGVSAGFPGSDLLGTPTLGADSPGTERLFVGIGSRPDVDEYLAGAAFQAVRQEGGAWESLSIPGNRKPGVPSDETFWFRESAGNAPTIDFATSNGTGTFVVMHADGTPDVSARILIGYTSKWIFPLAIGAVVVGLLLALEGIILLRRSRRTGSGNDAGADMAANTDAPTPASPAAAAAAASSQAATPPPPTDQATTPASTTAPEAPTTVLAAADPPTGTPAPAGADPVAEPVVEPATDSTADPATGEPGVPDDWFRGPGAS